jgi:hypothetical protein
MQVPLKRAYSEYCTDLVGQFDSDRGMLMPDMAMPGQVGSPET